MRDPNFLRLGQFDGPKPSFSTPLERSLFDHDKYKGSLIIGGIEFMCLKRPNRFHQLMMRWIFGWEWKDKEK